MTWVAQARALLAGAATPGDWRLGRHSSEVVGDPTDASQLDGRAGADHVGHYGGLLVGESFLEDDAALVAAAPRLLRAALEERRTLIATLRAKRISAIEEHRRLAGAAYAATSRDADAYRYSCGYADACGELLESLGEDPTP